MRQARPDVGVLGRNPRVPLYRARTSIAVPVPLPVTPTPAPATADNEPAGAEAGAAPPIPSSGSHKRYTELLGGVIGGAAAGAGLGFLVGGPVGAVVGGVVGLIAGAILGARLGRKRLTGPIADPMVQAAMRTAWTDSRAASAAARHEESGYIVRHPDGTLAVERWPRGAGASISPPALDAHGRYHGFEVLGEFHTHPNPPVDEHGRHWVPGPSPGDIT